MNKDLLKIAMPFISLSGKQWNAFINFVDDFTDKESELYKTLQTLMINQSRIEIISDYDFYYGNENKGDSINL
jgi:hypothetical protein